MKLIECKQLEHLLDTEYKETVKLINKGEVHLNNLAEGFTESIQVIRALPEVDAVPVVRCANCIHLNVLNDKIYYAQCEMTNTVFESFKLDTRTHFCSLGRKKEEENK